MESREESPLEIRDIRWLYWDNGKENGNYRGYGGYMGLGVYCMV